MERSAALKVNHEISFPIYDSAITESGAEDPARHRLNRLGIEVSSIGLIDDDAAHCSILADRTVEKNVRNAGTGISWRRLRGGLDKRMARGLRPLFERWHEGIEAAG